MANANKDAIQVVSQGGGYLSPYFVVMDVDFDASGDASVTATELGLSTILGFAGGVMGGTTNAVAAIYSDTTFSATGVSTLSLEARESDGGVDADLNITVSVLFWGTKK